MHSPLDNTELETFFHRLNAPLKRMPLQYRADLHVELRQHLDGLVAAHEELGESPEEALRAALRQFGEPKKIGRRLFQEWQRDRARRQAGACLPAALYAVAWIMGLEAVCLTVMGLDWSGYAGRLTEAEAGLLAYLGAPPWLHLIGYTGSLTTHAEAEAELLAFFGAPSIAGLVTGWKFRERALPGVFYATLPFTVLLILSGGLHTSLPGLAPLFWSPLGTAVAYGVSSLRRGGAYWPEWSSLMLRLR